MGKYLSDYTLDLLEKAKAIVTKENRITIRGVFYRLVSIGMVSNNPRDYRKVAEVIGIARWAYLRRTRSNKPMSGWEIPFESILDESRELVLSSGFGSLNGYLDHVSTTYGR